ncbi:MAG: helix-turn-helix transcriptional regulator [Clostridia bacterium]|nr:helix-turn-helix transcriptional regulator [Clostridia bacterium]
MFYDVLEKLCKSKGKSVFAVTTELDITASTVSYWKKKGTAPKGDTLAKIASYFGVSTDYLLNGTDNTTKIITDDDIKFALFGGMNVSDKVYEDIKKMAIIMAEKEMRENEKS